MATTDPAAKAVQNLFLNEMMPLADKLRAGGRVFLTTGFDPQAKSYYIDRSRGAVSPKDFETPSLTSPATLSAELTEFWRARGASDLIPLTASIAKLAALLHGREEQTDDVSPFVYVMY